MAKDLDIIYKQEAITPFWKKLPFIFAFPLHGAPLVFMLCIVIASTVAGLALGPFSMLFKGLLGYLGLRFGFNVLELFAKGRFEGHSVDHTLWGPEKRPAKLGLVITLFIVASIQLGQFALQARISRDVKAQDALVAEYTRLNPEIAQAMADRLARPAPKQPVPAQQASSDEDGESVPTSSAHEPEEPADLLPIPTRAEMVEAGRPGIGEPLWLRLQPPWYWLVVALLSLLLPSAAIVIALEDKLFRALNPLNMLHLVSAMGRAYFALWAFFLAIAGARHLALSLGSGLPSVVRFPIEMAAATYLGLVLFALMGYALYQYHQELHLDVEVDFDAHRDAGGAEGIAAAGSAGAALRQNNKQVDPFEQKLQALVAAGNVKEAMAEVRDRMRYDRFDVQLNMRLHALHVQQNDVPALLAHGQQWLTALARAGQGRQALAALRELQTYDAGFTVAEGDVVLPAAHAAVREGEFPLAAALLRQFDKRFPGHRDTAGVMFLAARLLSEHGRQHDKAAKILRGLMAHFPDSSVAAEAKAYLQVLESMAQSA